MEMKRRGFLIGLGAALAAPAVVRAEIIMPVKRIILPPQAGLLFASKGFPNRGAPLGSKWLQNGLTHRIEWTMGADGYWAPGLVEAKMWDPGGKRWDSGAPLFSALHPTGSTVDVELLDLSEESLVHEVRNDFRWYGPRARQENLAMDAVEQEKGLRLGFVSDPGCPNFAAEDRRATEMRWNARAEERFGKGAVWRSAAPITGGFDG